MSQEPDRSLRTFTVGRHSRPLDLASVRRACLTTLVALVAQFGLGMWLNLYVPIPAADVRAGLWQEIRNGPALLTVHALVGAFLIGAAIVLLIRAVRVRSRQVITLASAGLGAILCAFAAGESFVRDGGESRASLSMAVFTGVALLCYVIVQALTSAARSGQARAPLDVQPAFAPRLPQRVTAGRPRPGDAGAFTRSGWPNVGYAAPAGPDQTGYGRAMPGPAPGHGDAAARPRPATPLTRSGPQPAYPRAARPYAQPRNAYRQPTGSENTSRLWNPGPEGYYPGES